MKIREDKAALWSLQCKEFEGDETGRQFLTYLTLWCDAAEAIIERDHHLESVRPVRDCFLEAMDVPEHQLGKVDGTFMGPMLMYIISAWEYGEALADELSVIELRVVASAVDQQREHLQQLAEQRSNESEPAVDS
ncbi:hypothetical protein SEA_REDWATTLEHOG_63 [Gordonia phage RedWattleHog]|uniref:Uncharacterized protein n=1 Tax=Gordonia phage Stormageddon TaxID=2656541 RepID=A0A649VTN5_9CAUD|nr:hypothetical protein KHQ86_gp060 [Gordonia phage Stormageddon]QGJ94923.1 hypothetical protein SEA_STORMAGEDDON_60 [Gordonia phage Stormageddon]QLF83567.1 hypothetical protein SEA_REDWATTLEHOG_63 [Gordonia phage RedWattleHog]